MTTHPTATDFDVAVIGGGFAGSSLAILLRRWLPESRILIVEGRGEGERKVAEVGEATVEVSACFLHKVLEQYEHCSREQLPKHGLRYWFTDGPNRPLSEMSEVGPKEVPRLPSFQLDRAVLDEHLLSLAAKEGAEVRRGVRVTRVEHAWPSSTLTLASEEGERQVTSRWVVDASGRRAVLSRSLGLYRRTEEHPTSAIWARWNGVKDLDGPAVLGKDPRKPKFPELFAARRLATNHFCGYGYWCWAIPLAGGRTSVGLVYDKELFQLPGGGSKSERYRHFVRTHPGLRELLADARMEKDLMAFSHLPYSSSRYMDRGWALVGDAGAFLDPYYSPGLDFASISSYATALNLEADLSGKLSHDALDAAIATHNERFVVSYDRWIEALYLGKYELMGDAELTGCAYLVDTSLYYMGVVTPIYRNLQALQNPLFGASLPQAKIAYWIMRTFNRRLLRLARLRRQVGTYGRRNAGLRIYNKSFGLGAGSLAPLLQGLRIWLSLELQGLASRLRRGPIDTSKPVPASDPVPSSAPASL